MGASGILNMAHVMDWSEHFYVQLPSEEVDHEEERVGVVPASVRVAGRM